MKGIVFTEFMELVEDKFGDEVLDDIIDDAETSTDGAFTAVGTYPHSDMINLVVELSKKTQVPVDKLVYTFGHYLAGRFSQLYPSFFHEVNDTFSFLESIDNHIHVEVRKLYPDAELPRFYCKRIDDQTMEMLYTSDRAMYDLAEGLIIGTSEYYKEKVEVSKEIKTEDGKEVVFTVKRV